MTPLERMIDAVDELTRPRTHREPFTYHDEHGTLISSRHVTRVASLLEQLGASLTPSGEIRLDTGHSVPGSRPTARIESLDALIAIDAESTRLLLYVGGKDRGDTASNLRGLVGRMPQLPDDDQDHLASCGIRWASRAKSVTGWEVQPWRPENTCPLCAQLRSLRVRVQSASEVHASCVACGETWTPETAGLLIEHIRWENQEDELPDVAESA